MSLLTPDFVMYSLNNQVLEACSSGNLERLLELEPCIQDLRTNPKASLFLSCAVSAGQFAIVRTLLRKGIKPDCLETPDYLYEKTGDDVFREIKGLLLRYTN